MLEHHLQRDILYKLVTSPSARFADLKPADVDGNIFTYHLQQLIKQKLVLKQADGSYGLTALGKAAGINIKLSPQALMQQAHSIILMAAIRPDGAWLLRKRLAHPMYGKYGFVHGEPVLKESVTTTAAAIFKQKTDLQADFAPRGGGYIRIFKDGDMESFTHFTLLVCENPAGELRFDDQTGQNEWLTKPDFASDDMIPSMQPLVELIQKSDGLFFTELEYHL